MRVAINGFGRIGRNVLRAGINSGIEWVAVNDMADTATLAHLFKYDSVHGRFSGVVKAKGSSILINGKEIKVINEPSPEKLPWAEMGVDVVIESTGRFRKRLDAEKHIIAGAKKVLISAPAENPDSTIVLGVNDDAYKKSHKIVSLASCTTNCLAPMAKVLNDNFGISKGFITTTHAYTGDQKLLDGPHKDLRRARAAAMSIIPTSTGAAKALGFVIPELQGKLDGIAMRVPTANVSITDFVCELKKSAGRDDINNVFRAASRKSMRGILEYIDEPLVSVDFDGNPHSCIFDSLLTNVIGKLVKVVGWYDNEWGYSCRMVDMLKVMGK